MCPGIKRNLDGVNVLFNVWSDCLIIGFHLLSLFYLKSFLPNFQRAALRNMFHFGFGAAWVVWDIAEWAQCSATRDCSAWAIGAKRLQTFWPQLGASDAVLGLCSLESLYSVIFVKADKLKHLLWIRLLLLSHWASVKMTFFKDSLALNLNHLCLNHYFLVLFPINHYFLLEIHNYVLQISARLKEMLLFKL